MEKTQLVLFLVFTWPHLPLLSLTTAKGKRQTKKNDFVVLDYFRNILCSKYQLQLTNEKKPNAINKNGKKNKIKLHLKFSARSINIISEKFFPCKNVRPDS